MTDSNGPYPTEELISECMRKFSLLRMPAIRLIRRHHGVIPKYADSADNYEKTAEKPHSTVEQKGIFDDE